MEDVDGARAVLVDTGVVGEEAHPSPLQAGQAFAGEDVDAREHRGGRCRHRRRRRRVQHGRGRSRCRRDVAHDRGREGGDAGSKRRHVPAAVGVQAAREDDDVAPGGRIKPQARPGEARVAVRADRKQLAARRRVRRVDVPAQSADRRHARRCRARRHARDGRRREDANPVQLAAGEQHSREAGQVLRRSEQSGMAGDAAHATGRGIVHDPAEREGVRPLAGPLVHFLAALGRCDSRPEIGPRQEPGVAHPERAKQDLLRVDVQRFPAGDADDFAEQEVVDVAIDEALARRRGQHLVPRELDGSVIALPRLAKIQVRSEARGMRHQVSDRDPALPVALEARNPGRDRIAQADATLFDQRHDGGGRRHDLCKRRQVEHRIEGHRLAGWDGRALAVRREVQGLGAPADQDHRARCLPGRDCGLHDPVDAWQV